MSATSGTYHGPRQAVADIGDDEALNFGDNDEYDFVYDTSPNPSEFQLNQGANKVWSVPDGQQGVVFEAGVSLGGASERASGLDVGGGDIVDGGTTIWDSSAGAVVAPISGTFADGSAANPSISFTNDGDLGLFRPGTDALGIAAGGTEQARWTASGLNLRSNIDLEGTGADTVVTLDDTFDLVVEDDAGTDIFAIRESGLTEVVSGDLRIPTGNVIEDGSGTARYSTTADSTFIQDGSGTGLYEASTSGSSLFARSGQPVQIRDAVGSFKPLVYDPSASAPGTLTLDANTFIKDGAGLVVGDTGQLTIGGQEPPLQVTTSGTNTTPVGFVRDIGSTDGNAARAGLIIKQSTSTSAIDGYGSRVDWINEDGSTTATVVRQNAVRDGADDQGAYFIETAANGGTITEALRLNSSQQTLVTDGSASTPALSFINDTDLGFFRPAPDEMGLSGDLVAPSGGTGKIGTATDHFNEMHATSFITHSPEPRDWPDALESIREYAAGFGSMEMEEMVADLVAVVKEQQAAIEDLQRQVNPQ